MADVFVPLNSFKSVLTTLTGEEDVVYTTPSGVSTIVLSAQITNVDNQTQPVTIKMTSNRELPVPQTGSINHTGSFSSASALIELNQTFIEKEAAAYINFQNNLQEIPFEFTSSIYEGYVNTALDGIKRDLVNGGTLGTQKAAQSFYNKNGVYVIPTEGYEFTSSFQVLDYANTLLQQILKNENITGSSSVLRFYQDIVTQSFDESIVVESGSIQLVSDLLTVISDNISNPVRVIQKPIDLIKNVEIPAQDSLSPIVAGKLVLEEEFSLIISGSKDTTVILSILESANE